MVPTVKHVIINISIFLAPTRSDNLPIMTVMTAPETIYAVITQEAMDREVPNSCEMLGRDGDMAVLRYRNINILQVNTKCDFQALNDICSEGTVAVNLH